jgi:hypothetical protein
MFQVLHYGIMGFLLFATYALFAKSFEDDNIVRNRYKNRWGRSINKDKMEQLFKNEWLDQQFRKAGVPLSSTYYNLIRYAVLIVAVGLGIIDKQTSLSVIPPSLVYLAIILFVLSWPIKGEFTPLNYFLGLARRSYKAKQSSELYQLYTLIKTELRSDERKVSNTYHLLANNRQYFNLIRPAIDQCLARWKDGSEVAWDVFAKELGTDEAATFAMVMKKIDGADLETARKTLEQKRQEFANANYNAYKEYLDRRRLVMYTIALICCLPLFIYIAVPYVLDYRAVMDQLNSLQ